MRYNDGGHTISRNKRELDDIDLLVLAALHVDSNENADVKQNAIRNISHHERRAGSYALGEITALHRDINELHQRQC